MTFGVVFLRIGKNREKWRNNENKGIQFTERERCHYFQFLYFVLIQLKIIVKTGRFHRILLLVHSAMVIFPKLKLLLGI